MAIPAASCRERGNLGAGYIEKELLFY